MSVTEQLSPEDYIKQGQMRINTALAMKMPLNHSLSPEYKIIDAMRYSVFNGGKRLRALLVYASAEAFGTNPEMANSAAMSVEMMHAYSLIHDDLPAMDDAPLRRGKASCHVAFDEATAILAGDGLQALAIETIVNCLTLRNKTRIKMVQLLTKSVGLEGMVGGQALDIYASFNQIDLSTLEKIHALKTGALLRSSILLGALSSEKCSTDQLHDLDQFATPIGLAFQIRDDIIDIESDTQTLGKIQGKDSIEGKATYPSLTSIEAAKEKTQQLYQQAADALQSCGQDCSALLMLANFIINRKY